MTMHLDRRRSTTLPALAFIIAMGGDGAPAEAGTLSCSNPTLDPVTLQVTCAPSMPRALGLRTERPVREMNVGQPYAMRVIDPAKFKATGFDVPAHTRMLVVRESDDTLKILHEETGESRRVKLDRRGQVLVVEKLS